MKHLLLILLFLAGCGGSEGELLKANGQCPMCGLELEEVER